MPKNVPKKKTFQQRLVACQQVGNLTTADLQRWFDRPYQTVRQWVEKGIEPGGGPIDREHAIQLLGLLEMLIEKRKGFPIPRLPPAGRIAHLVGVRKAVMKGIEAG